jgi:two-component system chemotaxis response regulator CheY
MMMEHILTQRRILVVDDEQKVAMSLRDGLEMLPNCEVAIATGGKQALQFCQQHSFNLLITDYHMPDMTGLALATQVRQLYPQVPIIMLTAHDNRALCSEHTVCASIQCILNKPAQLEEIRSAVLDALEESTLLDS